MFDAASKHNANMTNTDLNSVLDRITDGQSQQQNSTKMTNDTRKQSQKLKIEA